VTQGTPAATTPSAAGASAAPTPGGNAGQAGPALTPPAPASRSALASSYGRLPLSFEANQGQAAANVQFLAHGNGYTAFLTSTGAVLAFQQPVTTHAIKSLAGSPITAGPVVGMELVGANPAPEAAGLAELPGKVNYLVGKDPAGWHTGLPTYAQVDYQNVYPGIDLAYHGNQGQLEYDFVLAPGANPGAIGLSFSGADQVSLDARGNLILSTGVGSVVQAAPVAYQEVNGVHQDVAAGFVLAGKGVGFQVGAYNPSLPWSSTRWCSLTPPTWAVPMTT
jgi:hypothetical protein